MTRRTERVAELIRDELSRLIPRERALEGALLTLTYVDVSPDLKHADVYYTSLNQQLSPQQLGEKLNQLRHSWQREIGRQLHIKFTPRLSFKADRAHQRGDRVMQILDSLSSKKQPSPSEAD